MRQIRKVGARCAVVLGLLGVVFLAGCQTGPPEFADVPGSETGAAVGGSGSDKREVLHVGDSVRVSRVAPAGEKEFTPHDEKIKEDGIITPPDVGPIVAAGRTLGDLQRELQEKYSKLYKNMTVTVTSGERYYYVDGEVRQSGPKTILAETDLVNAISAAGGFTDFANKKKVRIIRKNGETDVVNYNKAILDSGYNVRIYPGDKIYVPRRFW